MMIKLTKGLDEQDLLDFKAQFAGSARMRKHIVHVLEEDIKVLQNSMLNEDYLSSPNWSIYQADRVAQIKALRKVIALFEN